MADDPDRKRIMDRADRMLGQSKRLRKVADELLTESNDLRRSVKRLRARAKRRKREGGSG